MRKLVLLTILVASIGLAIKLAFKPVEPRGSRSTQSASPTHSSTIPIVTPPVQSQDVRLLSKFPEHRELVERLVDSFGHNARRIAERDGVSGLRLLDQLGDAGVCLSEQQPDEFHRLSRLAATTDAAHSIAAWHTFLDPRQNDEATTSRVAREMSQLPPRAWTIIERTPEALPFLLLDPRRSSDMVERLGPEVLDVLALVDLSDGGRSYREAHALLSRHGRLAIRATQEMGPTGFLLVERYGTLLAELEPELGLRTCLAVVGASMEDLDELLVHRRPAAVSSVLIHLWERHKLLEYAGCRYALRTVVEFGSDGERALELAGPRVAEVIYGLYPEGPVRTAILQAIVQGGVPAAVAAEKFGNSARFQYVVTRDGTAAVLAVASSCSAEEAKKFLATKPRRTWSESLALTALRLANDSGDSTIRMIERDGVDRVQSLNNSEVQFHQLLPLYDLSHIGGVLFQGQVPTRGEFVWAGVDAGLVTVDILSLLALQPEGAAASEAARTGVKSAVRLNVKSGGRAAVEHAVQAAAGQPARSAARELVQGTGQWLAREAVAAGTQAQEKANVELTKALASRSAIRLMRDLIPLVKSEGSKLATLPYNKFTKYAVANSAQAGVGIWAIRKMEEYLDGRDPERHNRSAIPQHEGDDLNEIH